MINKSAIPSLDHAMNPVQGCAHGCRYPCYAFMMAKHFGRVRDYEDWISPAIVSNTLELVEKDLKRKRDKIKHVQLCLMTDPFMEHYPQVGAVCLEAIRMINGADIPCGVLTKGRLPIELAELDERNTYGISLIALDEDFRAKWEPGSAPYLERIKALKNLHDRGAQTWVHIEPYPTPNIHIQDIKELLEAVSFVDSIDLLPWNYSPMTTRYPDAAGFYRAMNEETETFCLERGIEFKQLSRANRRLR
jgi:DNA repair photolyase